MRAVSLENGIDLVRREIWTSGEELPGNIAVDLPLVPQDSLHEGCVDHHSPARQGMVFDINNDVWNRPVFIGHDEIRNPPQISIGSPQRIPAHFFDALQVVAP